ncbi:hypothetical protein GCM10010442_40410 [Kitasatospora kifunensis]
MLPCGSAHGHYPQEWFRWPEADGPSEMSEPGPYPTRTRPRPSPRAARNKARAPPSYLPVTSLQ